MSSERPDPILLSELRESANLITSYVKGFEFDAFRANMLLRDAVCMRLIVIGEAANRMTDEGRASLPGLSWDKMASLRHLVAHDYGAASPTLLWSIVTMNVPELAMAMSAMPED